MPVKSLTDIKPNKANPRRIKKDRQEKLSEYLAEYGDLSGVVYNANPECEAIISGHQRTAEFKRQKGKLTILERYEPAQGDGTTARGFIETPNGQRYLYREVNWPKEKADAATIIANGQFGEWDSDILANEWNFDVPEFREFGVPEFVFGGDGMDGEGGIPNNALNSEAKEDDFEAPAIEEVVTDIKLGDLFEIGPHRLLCGDSTIKDNISSVLDGNKKVIVFSDPPYGIEIVKNSSVGGGGPTKFGGKTGKTIGSTKGFSEIIGDSTTDAARGFYFSCLDAGIRDFIIFGGNYFTDFLPPSMGWIVWNKKNTGNFADFEMAWTSFEKAARIYEYLWNGLSREGSRDLELKKRVHPTQKPVGLSVNILSNYDFEIIFDGFLGSGTTMVAAHQLNRRCYGMEIDPKYCQVIVNRMMKLDPSLEIKRNGEPYNPK